MIFKETEEFKKDFKKLSKKYQSLPEDLEEFKTFVRKNPTRINIHSAVLHVYKSAKIMKARFRCKYLKRSSLRIIYAYHEKTNEIEFIEFIELYHKNNQTRENQERIDSYLKDFEKWE